MTRQGAGRCRLAPFPVSRDGPCRAMRRLQSFQGLILAQVPWRAEEDLTFALIVRIGQRVAGQLCLTHPAVVHRARVHHGLLINYLSGFAPAFFRRYQVNACETCKSDL